jgi:hypothetical protein
LPDFFLKGGAAPAKGLVLVVAVLLVLVVAVLLVFIVRAMGIAPFVGVMC